MTTKPNEPLGFLRSCMDRRFVAATRQAFEAATGLGPTDYWHEAYAGGSALDTDPTGLNYAHEHGASIYGWQAHINGCGGQPGVSDEEIAQRLDEKVAAMVRRYPRARHFRILASVEGVDIREVERPSFRRIRDAK